MIIIGIIIVIILVVIYFLYTKSNKSKKSKVEALTNDGTFNINNKRQPILTVFKTGGIMGMIYRVEIYDDKSYILFDKNQVQAIGQIDAETDNSVNYILKKFPKLKNDYCVPEGYDIIYISLQVKNKTVNLGHCVPQDIAEHFEKLDKLMN